MFAEANTSELPQTVGKQELRVYLLQDYGTLTASEYFLVNHNSMHSDNIGNGFIFIIVV